MDLRDSDQQMACFDPADEIRLQFQNDPSLTYIKCDRTGYYYEDYTNSRDDMLQDEIETYPAANPLKWSDELALSASWYLQDITGCNVHPDRVIDNGEDLHYIQQIATFDNHLRVTHIPERFNWVDPKELVYDLLMDDTYWQGVNSYVMLNNDISQIGVACSCHPTYEQICVFEFGLNVEPLEEMTHTHTGNLQANEEWHVHPMKNWNGQMRSLEEIPQFPLPHEYCPDYRSDGACDEVENRTFTPPRIPSFPLWEEDITTQDVAQDLFEYINLVRNDPLAYTDNQETPWSECELESWDPSGYPSLKWSEALAMAARQVANIEGSCLKEGDEFGNTVQEALLRFYAYDVEGLEVIAINSTEYAPSAPTTFEYILGKKCIDKQLFKTNKEYMGIGCGCTTDYSLNCYFVTADKVTPKRVIERVPTYQKLLQYNIWGDSYTPYKSGNYIDDTDRSTCEYFCPLTDPVREHDNTPVYGFYNMYLPRENPSNELDACPAHNEIWSLGEAQDNSPIAD